ncbi:MAG: PAS domain-containing protein [Chloroflexi bacterium]|nr:PAS domain-containing protein [Chloroflexota bacterium]
MKEVSASDQPFPGRISFACSQNWLDGGVAILAADGHAIEANEPLADWLETTPEGLTRKNFWDLLAARFPDWISALQDVSANAQTFRQAKLSYVKGDVRQWFQLDLAQSGDRCFVRLNSVLPPLAELEEAAWDEHLDHESARRSMFVRLLRAEAQLDNLMQRWPGVIFSQRPDFTFYFVSPKIVELTGVPLGDWRDQPQRFWQVVHELDAEELQQQIKSCAKTGKGITSTYRIRSAQTGRVTYVLEHRKAILTSNGLLLGYEGVWLDVTRQTIAENRLSSAAWKETLAVLTMGLAHDFSNIMSGILPLSESFLHQVNLDHPFHEGLSLIKQNSQQACQLVHRIINLHHGKTGERNYHDLNEIVTDVADLARKILPRRVQIRSQLAVVPLPLFVDAVEFRQVMINLILNASDAMPEGGCLSIQTSVHQAFPELPHVQGLLPRLPSVCLGVQDTGGGIKARHLTSIFDPFFTTKAMNKGSGLGLYNARMFAEKHHGAISVDSAEGMGTTFRVWLPQADFTEGDRVATASAKARRSLLLVGPDEKLLQHTAEFLRVNGYHVVVALSLEGANALLASLDYQFVGVMVLTNGDDLSYCTLFREARLRKPPLKTILQTVGCNQDQLDTDLVNKADLLVPPDMSQPSILAELNAVFESNEAASSHD